MKFHVTNKAGNFTMDTPEQENLGRWVNRPKLGVFYLCKSSETVQPNVVFFCLPDLSFTLVIKKLQQQQHLPKNSQGERYSKRYDKIVACYHPPPPEHDNSRHLTNFCVHVKRVCHIQYEIRWFLAIEEIGVFLLKSVYSFEECYLLHQGMITNSQM